MAELLDTNAVSKSHDLTVLQGNFVCLPNFSPFEPTPCATIDVLKILPILIQFNSVLISLHFLKVYCIVYGKCL